MSAALESLSTEQLRIELRRAEADLEELNEERLMILGQTGVHVGAHELNRITSSFIRDEARLRARIEAIIRLLGGAQ